MVGVRQLTVEVIDALRRSRRLMVLHYDKLVRDLLQNQFGPVEDLGSMYREGTSRLDTYREIAEFVLEAADSDAPVALALYGHPWVFVSPTEIIQARGEARG